MYFISCGFVYFFVLQISLYNYSFTNNIVIINLYSKKPVFRAVKSKVILMKSIKKN